MTDSRDLLIDELAAVNHFKKKLVEMRKFLMKETESAELKAHVAGGDLMALVTFPRATVGTGQAKYCAAWTRRQLVEALNQGVEECNLTLDRLLTAPRESDPND